MVFTEEYLSYLIFFEIDSREIARIDALKDIMGKVAASHSKFRE